MHWVGTELLAGQSPGGMRARVTAAGAALAPLAGWRVARRAAGHVTGCRPAKVPGPASGSYGRA